MDGGGEHQEWRMKNVLVRGRTVDEETGMPSRYWIEGKPRKSLRVGAC